MDDMLSRISELLDDPAQADKIKQIALSLSGTDSAQPTEESAPVVAAPERSLPFPGGMTRNIALLNAIQPFLRPSRAVKITSAIRAIQMIDILSKAK